MNINLSQAEYEINSCYDKEIIQRKISANTLFKENLIKVRTDKLFIGKVTPEGFYLTGSAPIEILCTVKGEFIEGDNRASVLLKTSMHRAFLILYSFWVVALFCAIIVSYISGSEREFPASALFVLPIAAIIGRFLIHAAYLRARQSIVAKLQELIE